MASLQEQLLKAGLVDEKKAKQAKKDKRKQTRVANKSKDKPVDENKQAAQQTMAEKAERDRELNKKRQEEAEQKAIAAQVKQLINLNKLSKGKGDIGYNFVDQTVKKIYVTASQQEELSSGRLAVCKLLENGEVVYEIVPAIVADKIAQRDASSVVMKNDKSADIIDEDDPYADYQIPDDLMW